MRRRSWTRSRLAASVSPSPSPVPRPPSRARAACSRIHISRSSTGLTVSSGCRTPTSTSPARAAGCSISPSGSGPDSCTSTATRTPRCRSACRPSSSPTPVSAPGARAVKDMAAAARVERYRSRVAAGLRAAAAVVAPTRRCGRPSSASTAPRTRLSRAQRPPRGAARRSPVKEPLVLAAGRLWDEAKSLAVLERAARRGCPGRSIAAGGARRPDGASRPRASMRRASATLEPRRAAGVDGRARHLRAARPATSRSAWRCSRRRWPAARWCSATSRASASCGATPRSSSIPTTPTALRRRARRADRRRPGARAGCAAARAGARARASRSERMAAGVRRRSTASCAGAPQRRPRGGPHAHRLVLPLAGLRLEPRQRALPARRRRASCIARGHDVARLRAARRLEPRATWSPITATAALDAFARAYPGPAQRRVYDPATLDLDAALDGADLVHRPRVERPGAGRAASARTARDGGALPRCCSTTRITARSPTRTAMARLRPRRLRRRARLRRGAAASSTCGRGWARARLDLARGRRHPRVPPARRRARARATSSGSATGATASATAELRRVPARAGRARSACARDVHGVRYPDEALARARRRRHRATRGWLPNAAAPRVFARHRVTVHVPRRPYVDGAARHPDDPRRSRRWPAASRWSRAPWDDARACSAPATTILVARDGAEMSAPPARPCCTTRRSRAALAARGLRDDPARATPARHRVDELLRDRRELDAGAPRASHGMTTP